MDFFENLIHQIKVIFWGSSSLVTLIELIFRTSFLYIYTLLLVRIIGKRGLATLAPFEMAVIVVLGSVLADPIMNTKTPLINGMVVMTVIVALQRLLVHLTENNSKIENLLESSPRQLVSNGIIILDSVHKEGFSREDLFLNLREKGIEQLGEVKCAFLETSGRVSVWVRDQKDVHPGLPLLPSIDSITKDKYPTGSLVRQKGFYSCQRCGETIFFEENSIFLQCRTCQSEMWVESSMVKVI
jgi:uncharacterized membrane protein YcaP (DUF421 family)